MIGNVQRSKLVTNQEKSYGMKLMLLMLIKKAKISQILIFLYFMILIMTVRMRKSATCDSC